MWHKAWYFRVLGIIESISFIALLITWFVYTITSASTLGGWTLFINIIMLAFILFFGPAFALLFFGHADMLEKLYPEENKTKKNNDYESLKENQKESKKEQNKEGQTVMILKDFLDDNSGINIPRGTSGKIVKDYGNSYRVQFYVDGVFIQIFGKKDMFS